MKRVFKMNSIVKKLYLNYNHSWIWCIFFDLFRFVIFRDYFHRRLSIKNRGSYLFVKKEVLGYKNVIYIGTNSLLYKNDIIIHGSNNTIQIGDNCKLGKHCKILLYGNDMRLSIGNNTIFTHDDELLLQENGSQIIIGRDCLFSHNINIRTSDAHPIYDKKTNQRYNYAKKVLIEDHVWITPHCVIQKGVNIGTGSIIATNTIVTKDIPSNCIAAGMPAKIVKENISWTDNFDNK